MGKIEAYPSNSPNNRIALSLETANGEYAPVYHVFREYIKNLTFQSQGSNSVKICHLNPSYNAFSSLRIDRDNCASVSYADLINVIGSIRVSGNLSIDGHQSEPYTIEYTIGRKDIVAALTFENGKIDGETFGKIIYDGLEFQFQKLTGGLKYPYFTMYVKEYLEQKYGKDINIQDGLRVYTTLDPKLQEHAENAIRDIVTANKTKHGASSAALVSMDNTTGRLLAMVG